MRPIRSFLALLLIGLFVAACAGSASSVLDTVGGPVDQSGSAPLRDGAVPAGGIPAPEIGKSGSDPVGGGGQLAAVDDAKIVRTGTMSLDVSDVPSAVRAARDAIIGLGGYVGASSTSNEGDRPSAQITYRIPVDRWEQALDALRTLGGLTAKVVHEQTNAVEVTSQIVDLDARIANLRASETALQAIAAQANKVSDVLEVEARLTDTRGQIESLDAQRKDLNDRAAFSELAVDFNVPVVAVTAATNGWDPAAIVDSALATSVSVVQGVATASIWFVIVWLPILLVLGLITLVVVGIARRLGIGRRVSAGPPPAAPVVGES